MIETSALEKFLFDNKAASFLFVKPGGNHGDFLIYLGMECLAKKLGLQFRSITSDEFLNANCYTEQIIYLHGGGGFNSWCSGTALKILQHALRFEDKLVIQGPFTVDDDAHYIQQVMLSVLEHSSTGNLVVFVRELTSLALFEKLVEGLGILVLLDKDTAFWADTKVLEKMAGSSEKYYRLYAVREDNEVSGEQVHNYGEGVFLDPAYFCKSFEHWLRVHLFAKQIITSRTHSSILGALLGKPVVLYPSKYHKNKSIWEYNLKQLGVAWGPEGGKTEIAEKPHLKFLPKSVSESYKVNQVVRWLQRVPLS
jgi:exopolysaccharide biosynthesis predicted pyruvyltransferase EpsI